MQREAIGNIGATLGPTKRHQRLESTEMWIWQRILKIKWTEHATNEEALKKVGEERSLIDTIYQKQKKWLGHTMRHQGLLRDVIEGRLTRRRVRGRKRMTLLDHWRKPKDDGLKENYDEVKRRAEDRSR